jgi:hypothetical protein
VFSVGRFEVLLTDLMSRLLVFGLRFFLLRGQLITYWLDGIKHRTARSRFSGPVV